MKKCKSIFKKRKLYANVVCRNSNSGEAGRKHLKNLWPGQNTGKCNYNCLPSGCFQSNQWAFLRYYCAWCAGRLLMNQEECHSHSLELESFNWLGRPGKIPWPSGQKNIKWAGSFYNWIMRGNSAGTVWFRLPSLYKWSNLDIWVIGWLSAEIWAVVLCQWPRSQVSAGDAWMSFLSLWVCSASGPVLQTNTTLIHSWWV